MGAILVDGETANNPIAGARFGWIRLGLGSRSSLLPKRSAALLAAAN
jgi:hypothetical protein